MNDEEVGNSPWVTLNVCMFKIPYGKAIIGAMFIVAVCLLIVMFGLNGGVGGFIVILVSSVSLGYAIVQGFILFYSGDHIQLMSGINYYSKRKNRFEINLKNL